MPQLEPRHRLPRIPARAPPRRQPLHKLKPPAAFRLPINGTQLRHSRTAPVSDLHPHEAVPGRHCHRDRLTGGTRATVPDTVHEQLAHQESSIVPARMPRAEHRTNERADNPRPARQPGSRHALPNRYAAHHPLASSPAARQKDP